MGKKNSKIPPETLTQLRQCTAFSDMELGKWYKGFQKDCPSGRMTKKEFESIYKNFPRKKLRGRSNPHVWIGHHTLHIGTLHDNCGAPIVVYPYPNVPKHPERYRRNRNYCSMV